jgi:hypothetical protein
MPANTGRYVSMVIDSSNRLHIAAFDETDGDLKYIYVDGFASASPTVKAVTVDQFGMVGYWTSIKLGPNPNNPSDTSGIHPYRAYYNSTEGGGRESIKIAWAKKDVTSETQENIRGVDASGYTTGNWEYRTVPARDAPQGGSTRFQRVNLDFRHNGDPILGYLGANIEFSYPIGEE